MTYVWGLTDKGVECCKALWPLCKTFDDHSQRTLGHELEISYFRIALNKFALKNGLKLYWQQSDLKHTVSPDAMFALTDPAKPEGKKIPCTTSSKSSGRRSATTSRASRHLSESWQNITSITGRRSARKNGWTSGSFA